MLIEGKFELEGQIDNIWNFLLQPENLASCIPGCEKLDKIDNETFNIIVTVKVGFIKIKSQFEVKLVEIVPPTYLKASGKGQDVTKQGNFSMDMTIRLKEIPDNQVEIAYNANISVVGKLATFGDRIMRAKAKQLEMEFTQNLRQTLSGVTN